MPRYQTTKVINRQRKRLRIPVLPYVLWGFCAWMMGCAIVGTLGIVIIRVAIT